MSSNVVNREVSRDALATLLTTSLVATLGSVQAVYQYLVADFGGQSPVLVVTSGGTDRQKLAKYTVTHGLIYLDVHVFVLFALDDNSWTEHNAEDRLDLIEKQITDVLVDNYVYSGYWQSIEYDQRSEVDPMPIKVAGDVYRHERIPLVVSVQDQ